MTYFLKENSLQLDSPHKSPECGHIDDQEPVANNSTGISYSIRDTIEHVVKSFVGYFQCIFSLLHVCT